MTKAIMIQGTMSNSGKSLVTAGLCRIFKQDGYSVAPFKSQNMALNSFITADGLEMGRAQVVQAQAAQILPSVLMNPILLKPTNDVGSQVIVNGEVVGNMTAVDYFKYKKSLIPEIMSAYNKLSEQVDIIVIEGAGSPAEINLKADDIVNMGMAKLAKAPVLLVGDIDRGGVFAALYGTVMLLEDDEREIIKGTIINKFRGDTQILKPGLKMLEDLVKKPVLGVIPYMNIAIDDEDSLSERLTKKAILGLVDIAVIRFPHISNFTDLNPFEAFSDVSLYYVNSVSELQNPDLIILPGSKNTMGDLKWLRECGLEAAVLKMAASGVEIFGICGGYQMLGEELKDPLYIECGGEMRGMGLLPNKTVFEKQKVRTQEDGYFIPRTGRDRHKKTLGNALSRLSVEGYQIHMGRTSFKAKTAPLVMLNSGFDGNYNGNVYGTYLHGIFDKSEVCTAVVRYLFDKKGLDSSDISGIDANAFRESQYDLLAKTLRENLDMKAIYEILDGGI